ncbi:MAG: MoaD/ThiS family protein [Desulfamplus sp.]|nr:MoaD/ThiS family protein [Desulfamplus sp.]
MKIELKLFATIARYLPDSPEAFFVKEGITIREVSALLGIPESDVKLTFVNGKLRPLDYALENGDRLGMFPPVGGG